MQELTPELEEQLRRVPANYEGPVRKTPAINMDLATNADPRQVADMTFGMLNYLQNRRDFQSTGAQVVAIAAMFRLLTQVFGVTPNDALTVAGNLVSDASGKYSPEFKAIAMYIENEVRS